MSVEVQCVLGFLFSAVFLILFFALKFRNAGDNTRSPVVALQAHGAEHNYSVVAIVLVVVAVLVAMLAK